MNSPFTKPLVCLVFLMLFSVFAFSQHLADPEFKTNVERPAYSKNTPRVLFDEAHFNFHRSTGRYKPLADLLTNDGYRVVVNRQPFTKKSLESFKLLIVVNALGEEDIDEVAAENSAFTDEECSVVRDWVRGGGALLLIAGRRPFGNSAANLAKQFGVEMAGSFTQDDENCVEKDNPSLIIYSRENQLLADHPITQGREALEKVSRVIVFSGQSLKGPDESTGFLKLADSATEFPTASPSPVVKISARGRSQGLALKIGSGRAVVLAEADMLTALLGGPPEKEPIGMNYPGIDNRQLALNIMHWLSGLLK